MERERVRRRKTQGQEKSKLQARGASLSLISRSRSLSTLSTQLLRSKKTMTEKEGNYIKIVAISKEERKKLARKNSKTRLSALLVALSRRRPLLLLLLPFHRVGAPPQRPAHRGVLASHQLQDRVPHRVASRSERRRRRGRRGRRGRVFCCFGLGRRERRAAEQHFGACRSGEPHACCFRFLFFRRRKK